MIPLSVTSLPFLKVKVEVKVQGRVKYPNPTSSRAFPVTLEMKYKGKGYGVLMLKDRREIPGGEGGDMGFFLMLCRSVVRHRGGNVGEVPVCGEEELEMG